MSQNTTAMQRGAGGETTGATDMTTQQPEALDLADWLEAVGGGPSAKRCAALLREQHARITALESQLAQRFDAADMATASAQGFRDGVASLTAQAAPAAGAVAGPDDIDAIALTRYKVVHSHDSMFHRFAVVAGDGKQQLCLGRETECQNMARKFAGAFLDGAFYQSQVAAAPTPPAQAADSVQEDAARYRWLAEHCRSTSEHWGGRWSIIIDGPAPKSHDSEDDFDAAVDAARKQGATP